VRAPRGGSKWGAPPGPRPRRRRRRRGPPGPDGPRRRRHRRRRRRRRSPPPRRPASAVWTRSWTPASAGWARPLPSKHLLARPPPPPLHGPLVPSMKRATVIV